MVSKEMDESLLIGETQYKDEKRWHQEGQQNHSKILGFSKTGVTWRLPGTGERGNTNARARVAVL